MALLSDYTAGTVSSSGLVITGTGTAWQTAQFREGDEFIADGWRMLVQSVDSETQLTLRANSGVQGAALTDAPYRLRYMSDGSRASAQARQLIDLLGGSGNLEALAGLEGEIGKVPVFTGPGTMGLTDPGTPDPNGNLEALAGLVSAPDVLAYFTGAGAAALTDLTAFGRDLVGAADPAAAHDILGTATLEGLAGLTTAANKMPYFTGPGGAAALTDLTAFGRTLLDDANAAEALATLGALSGVRIVAFSTSGTYTPTNSRSTSIFFALGAGGGGGGTDATANVTLVGEGGGSGALSIGVSQGATVRTITIGAGGAGGVGTVGGMGGSTSVSSVCTAPGGAGGAAAGFGGGGAGGDVGTGLVTFRGNSSLPQNRTSQSYGVTAGSAGAPSFFGGAPQGGRATSNPVNGFNAIGPGAGGGGGVKPYSATSAANGGNGGDGYCLVMEFY